MDGGKIIELWKNIQARKDIKSNLEGIVGYAPPHDNDLKIAELLIRYGAGEKNMTKHGYLNALFGTRLVADTRVLYDGKPISYKDAYIRAIQTIESRVSMAVLRDECTK